VLSDFCQEVAISLYVKYTFEVNFSTRYKAQVWVVLLQHQDWLYLVFFISNHYMEPTFNKWLTYGFQGKLIVKMINHLCATAR
jgi:hypothetical protein